MVVGLLGERAGCAHQAGHKGGRGNPFHDLAPLELMLCERMSFDAADSGGEALNGA
jgi:hypothetical protein